MNFLNWRTDEQLLGIINNESLDYDIRIKAQEERMRRRWPSCKIPGCKRFAQQTWATIPVCQYCKETLTTEQLDYYAEKLLPEDRTLIYSIAPYMPWRHEELMVNP